MRTLNRLERTETRALEDWLLAHSDDAKNPRYSDAILANMASRSLEFTVTRANVYGARQSLNLPKKREGGGSKTRDKTKLLNRVRMLESFVLHMARQLGMEIPENFRSEERSNGDT